MKVNFPNLETRAIQILMSPFFSLIENLQELCNFLEENVSHYNWVGFYFKNGNKQELILGPYCGDPTDHTIIPFGKGICGQVALSNSTFVVPDVQSQDNYLSCNIDVKSEIVIPLMVNEINIGQLDIDSHTSNAFTQEDQLFLSSICKRIEGVFSDIQKEQFNKMIIQFKRDTKA